MSRGTLMSFEEWSATLSTRASVSFQRKGLLWVNEQSISGLDEAVREEARRKVEPESKEPS